MCRLISFLLCSLTYWVLGNQVLGTCNNVFSKSCFMLTEKCIHTHAADVIVYSKDCKYVKTSYAADEVIRLQQDKQTNTTIISMQSWASFPCDHELANY